MSQIIGNIRDKSGETRRAYKEILMVVDDKDNVDNGRFAKGHPYYPSKEGNKSGRHKGLKRQVKDAIALAKDKMPEIFAMLEREALQGNIQAANILIERVYGKPKQEIDGRFSTSIQVSADDYMRADLEARDREDRLLSQPTVTTIGDDNAIQE